MNDLNFALVIRILKRAREMTWDGVAPREGISTVCEYVCINVDRAKWELSGMFISAEGQFIKSKISDYIGGSYTYGQYYADKNGLLASAEASPKTLQDGRYEMIDALIAYATPLAILQNATARLWDGEDGEQMENVKATYVCHAITYATVDVLGLDPSGERGWAAQDSACSTAVAVALHARVSEKIDRYSTANGFYRSTFGDYTPPALQAFRANLLAEMFTEFSAKPV